MTTAPPEPADPVEVLLLDCDGVLQGLAHDWPDRIARVLPGVDPQEFIAAANAVEDPSLVGDGDFGPALAALAAERGWDADLEELLDPWKRVDVEEEVHAFVAGLRRTGLPVYLATNQHRRRGTMMRTELGYDDLFDGGFYSWEMGVAKPDPAYFHRIVTTLGRPADRLLFVDDREDNVVAARAQGLRAEVWHHGEGLAVLRERLARHGITHGV